MSIGQDPKKAVEPLGRTYKVTDPTTGETVKFKWQESREPEEHDLEAVFEAHYKRLEESRSTAVMPQAGGPSGSGGTPQSESSATKQRALEDEARARILITETERIKADPKIQGIIKQAESINQALEQDKPLKQYSQAIESFQKDFPDYEKTDDEYARRLQEFDKSHPGLEKDLDWIDRMGRNIERQRTAISPADTESATKLQELTTNYNRKVAQVEGILEERRRILDERRSKIPEEADQRAQELARLGRTPEVSAGLSRLKAAQEFYQGNSEVIDYYRNVQEGIQSIRPDIFTKVAYEGERGERLMKAAESEIQRKKQETRDLRAEAEEGVLEDLPFTGMPSTTPGGAGLISLIGMARMTPEQRQRASEKIQAVQALREEEHLLDLASRQLKLATIAPRTQQEFAGRRGATREGALITQAAPGLKRVATDFETFLPFIGTQIEAGYNSRLFIAQEKAKADPTLQSLTPGEQELLKAADIAKAYEASRPLDTGTKAILGIAGSIPWMIEIGLTQNLYRDVSFGLYRTMKRAMDSPVLVRRIMATTLGRATQAGINIPRQELQYTQLRLEGLDSTEALWKSFLMNQASYAAEMAGEPIGKVGSRLAKNLIAIWTRKQASKEVAQTGFAAWLHSGALFHGFGPEVAEEELEYGLHQTILGRQIKLPFATDEGTERLMDEAIAIGFMSGGFKGVDFGVRGIGQIVGEYDAKAQEKRLKALDADLYARFPSVRVRDIREMGLDIQRSGRIEGFGSLEEIRRMDEDVERAKSAEEARQRALRQVPESKFRPVENVPTVPESEQELREDLVAAGVAEADVVRMTTPELRNRWKQEAGLNVTEIEKAEAVLSKYENRIDPDTNELMTEEDILRRHLKVTRPEARSILQKLGKQVEIPKKTSEITREDFGEDVMERAAELFSQYRNVSLSRLSREFGISPQQARRLRELVREKADEIAETPSTIPKESVKITEPEPLQTLAPSAVEKPLLPNNVRNKYIRDLGLNPENPPSDQEIINMVEQRGLSQRAGTTERIAMGQKMTIEQAKQRWEEYKRSRAEAIEKDDLKLASSLSLIKEELEGFVMQQRGWKEHRILTATEIERALRGEKPTNVRDLFELRNRINEKGRYQGRADDIREAQDLARTMGFEFRMDTGSNTGNVYDPETGKKLKDPGPEKTYGDIEPDATLLKELPAETVRKIQAILYNLGSSIDVRGLTKPQIEAAIRDIKVDAGKEATLRAQIVIEQLLSDIDEGTVGARTPGGGVVGVNVDELPEPPPGEFPEEEQEFTPPGEQAPGVPENVIVAETERFRVESDQAGKIFIVRDKQDDSMLTNEKTRTTAFGSREDAITAMKEAEKAEQKGSGSSRLPETEEEKLFFYSPVMADVHNLALRIYAGMRNFSPEELQLQQNYPRELEGALSMLRKEDEDDKKKRGQPKRFEKTKAGDQGVLDIDMQRTQSGLGGIKSNIPTKKQVEGTPLFTKPAQPPPPGLFEPIEKKVTDEEAKKSLERIKGGFKNLFGPGKGGTGAASTLLPIDPVKLEEFFQEHKQDFATLWRYAGQKAEEFLKALADLPDEVKNYVLGRIREESSQSAAPQWEGNVQALQPPVVDDNQDVRIADEDKQAALLAFSEDVLKDLGTFTKHDARSLQKLAAKHGVVNSTEIKEAVEYAIIRIARSLVSEHGEKAFEHIVRAYDRQPSLTMRSSGSIALQQYSTPIPISYLMQLYTGATNKNASVFEPTGGNGMLLFAGNPVLTYANEIDPLRRFFLSKLTTNVTADDATQPFEGFAGKFDVVLANPPFGGIQPMVIDGYRITKLEHLVTFNALETMKDTGRAAILIGGHNEYDNKARLKKDRTFMNWLYHNYNVADVINVNGDLYRKQGTSFPIRLILINGRKEKPDGIAPLRSDKTSSVVDTFDDLFTRINEVRNETVLRSENLSGEKGGDPLFTPSPRGLGSEPGELRGLPSEEIGTPSRKGRERGERPVGDVGGAIGRGTAGQPEPARGRVPDPRVEFNEEPTASFPTEVPSAVANTDADVTARSREIARRDQPRVDLGGAELDVPYSPRSSSSSVSSAVPRNMASDTFQVLQRFEEEHGNIDDFVRKRLGYADNSAMHEALAGEQVDGVALAIANVEKGGSFIIGDQGGMGKGRIAAALIRYANRVGLKPIFITEKKHLFSDMYRDLKDIGSESLRPFIMNAGVSVYDENGTIIHEAPNLTEQQRIFKTGDLSAYAFVMMTYSQIASEDYKTKRTFLKNLASGNLLIMDESHAASGDSNTGDFIRTVIHDAKGVAFLSATYAKRPDNMPLYAMRSSLRDNNMTEEQLVVAFEHRSSVALQEMVSADLVQAGDMIRRERTFDGVNIDYKVLKENSKSHRQTSDMITGLVRDIIDFQIDHVRPVVESLDSSASEEGGSIGETRGVSLAGVDNTPFASKVHNVIEQMLFAIKADAIVDEAIAILKSGKKPIIAVRNTMESFLKDMAIGPDEDMPSDDFSLSLLRGLRNVMKVTETDAQGKKSHRILDPSELGPAGAKAYRELEAKIKRSVAGIPVSPIDYMLDKLEKAGYNFGEVTGRQERISYKTGKPRIVWREERDVVKTFRRFNKGELDGMILNAAGGTGTSAHASEKFKDQRQRVLLIHQVELDINKEVQKRYRIYRTGQVVKPEYLYMVSDIPAESRLLMVLKMKMRKLDANTTSSQKSSLTVEIEDFLNKYGDQIVIEYLKENPGLNAMIMDPFKMDEMDEGAFERFTTHPNAANRVAGRIAWLPVTEQEEFYREINERYRDLITYLEETGLNDLEMKTLPLNAKVISSKMLVAGTGKPSPFGKDSYLEELEVDVLRKPMLKREVDAAVAKTLSGKTPDEYTRDLVAKFEEWFKKYRMERMGRLRTSVSAADAEQKLNAMANYIRETLKRFRVGSPVAIPVDLGQQQTFSHSVGVFLGFDVKEDRKNPFLPSAVKLRFAVADSRRGFAIPISRIEEVESIRFATTMADRLKGKFDNWDKETSHRTRERRLVVTGNILQAVKSPIAAKGQFVSFTMDDGLVRRGILLPHTAVAKINATGAVNVPLSRAKSFILDIPRGGYVQTSDGQISFERETQNEWTMGVPKTKKRGGKYFLHPGILKLTKSGQFESKGDSMKAVISQENMDKLIDLLSDEFRQSINIDEDRLPATDFNKQGPVTFGMGLIPFVSTEDIRQAWKRVYGFFAHGTTELPLEDVRFADSELRHATKKAATSSRFFMKMLAAPNWTAEKYPGFGSTYLRGRVLREGVWETLVRISIHEFNENQRSIEIDLLNDWIDAKKLSPIQWNKLLYAAADLNEYNPIDFELPDDEIQKRYGLDDETVKVWRQMRNALSAAREFKKELDRYKILNGHYRVTVGDIKKYATEEALEAAGLDEDAIADVLDALNSQDADAKAFNRKIRAIWAIPEVREVVADGLVETKYEAKTLANFFPMTRPADHKWFVLAQNKGGEELPPHLASFGSAAEAQQHANSLKEQGYKPLSGAGRTWMFVDKNKRIELDEEQLKEWRYNHGQMTMEQFVDKYAPIVADHIVAYNSDKNFPEHVLRQLPEEYIYQVAESAGVDTANEAIQNVMKEMKVLRGFDRHEIQRERAPGFQWTQENLQKNIVEYVDMALRQYHKYVAMAEARRKFEAIKPELPGKLPEFIDAWMTGFTQATPEQWHLLRQVIYVTTLGNSLTFFVQNLTQPFLTTMNEIPIMLKEAGVKGLRGIGQVEKIFWEAHKYAKAWYLYKVGKKINEEWQQFAPSKEWLDLLERLRRRGVIQPLQFEEIGGFMKDPRRRYVYGGKTRRFVKRGWTFFADVVGLGSRFTELDNRTHAAMVAFIIGDKYLGLKGNDLLTYAERTIKRTQFPYGRHALPPILFQIRGNRVAKFVRQLASLLVILRSFAIQYLGRWFYVFRSGSPSAILRMLTASFFLAGIRAITPFNGILGTFLTLAFAAAGDDEPYETKERRILSKIEKELGLPKRFLTTGPIGAFAGVETSRLLGVGDIIPREVGELGGIIIGMGQRIQRATQAAKRGDVAGFLENAPGVPRQPAAFFRGERFQREGVVGRGGNIILPKRKLTPYDIWVTKLGFTPTSVYEAYEKNRALSRLGMSRVEKYYDFRDRYVRATEAGDQEEKREIIRDILEYNKTVPWYDHIDIANLIMAAMKERVGMPPLDKYIQKRMEYERIYE